MWAPPRSVMPPIRLQRGEESAASTEAAIAREIDWVESIWAVGLAPKLVTWKTCGFCGLVSPAEEAWDERDEGIESRLSYKRREIERGNERNWERMRVKKSNSREREERMRGRRERENVKAGGRRGGEREHESEERGRMLKIDGGGRERENAKRGGRVGETLGHPVRIRPCGVQMQDQVLWLFSPPQVNRPHLLPRRWLAPRVVSVNGRRWCGRFPRPANYRPLEGPPEEDAW